MDMFGFSLTKSSSKYQISNKLSVQISSKLKFNQILFCNPVVGFGSGNDGCDNRRFFFVVRAMLPVVGFGSEQTVVTTVCSFLLSARCFHSFPIYSQETAHTSRAILARRSSSQSCKGKPDRFFFSIDLLENLLCDCTSTQ
jgi:hypothetical protein